MVCLTALILGTYFTPVGFVNFVQHDQTLRYLIKNSTLFWGTTGSLPEVFASVPYPRIIHGSLWTLPFEVKMYVALGCLWLLVILLQHDRSRTFRTLVLLITVGALATHLFSLLAQDEVDQRRRLTYFSFPEPRVGYFAIASNCIRGSSQFSSLLF